VQVAEILERTIPTLTGLAIIPLIVHPIDNAVHLLLNNTLRPTMRDMVCNNGGSAVGLDMCSVDWKAGPEAPSSNSTAPPPVVTRTAAPPSAKNGASLPGSASAAAEERNQA
jgi:hypothetical protein